MDENILNKTFSEIKGLIDGLNLENIPLMKKPSEKKLKSEFCFIKLDNLRQDIRNGSQMRTHRCGADETVWIFPKGIGEKIEDEKLYKIWYTCRDAADPCDSSSYYRVYYVEEVKEEKIKLIDFLKNLLKNIE